MDHDPGITILVIGSISWISNLSRSISRVICSKYGSVEPI